MTGPSPTAGLVPLHNCLNEHDSCSGRSSPVSGSMGSLMSKLFVQDVQGLNSVLFPCGRVSSHAKQGSAVTVFLLSKKVHSYFWDPQQVKPPETPSHFKFIQGSRASTWRIKKEHQLICFARKPRQK